MENNAVSAGVKLGGLFNSTEIRILICYILNSIGEPVPSSLLVNELHFEGIANAFEVSDAIVYLAKNGHILLADKEDDSYTVTEKGIDTANSLKTSLSLTVKDRAFALTVRMLSRLKNAKQTDFKIEYENGVPYIVCSVLDGELPLLSIKLLLSDENQSSAIKERFLDNPNEIYKIIIDKLTK
ncbi:MAG: DUF4364 family protein [Clostridia bacterium]|nr:DUF4364 family protein [Clostridia bacterium]